MPTLNWIGKEKIITHHNDVPFRVLDKKYSYGNKNSENIIIHGDNLYALKSLLPKYEGQVDCIYIDPPYNTGKKEGQWVYSDNVNDPRIQKWIGQVVGEEGEDLSRHDKWLCMMYPRLKLLHKLLKDTGVILISINDYEYEHLKCICNEIFGPNNFVENFIWYVDGHTDNQDAITTVHEYILCFAKNKNLLRVNDVVDPNTPEDSKILNSFAENSITKNGFKNPASIIELPAGFPCESENLFKEKHENCEELINRATEHGFITREMTKELLITYPARLDDMIVENSVLKQPCRVYSGWMNNGKLLRFIENGFKPIDDNGTKVKFYLSKNGVIYYRRDGRKNHYIQSILENMGTTETNKYMLEEMGIKFDYPKPVTLIEYLLSMFTSKDSIILDSFAGSGTTIHATLSLNQKDGGKRKCISIEMMDYAERNVAQRAKCLIDGFRGTKIDSGFSFYELGEPIFDENLNLNPKLDEEVIKQFVYYTETHKDIEKSEDSNYLGESDSTAYYMFYKRSEQTCLNFKTLKEITKKADAYVIYADSCTLSQEYMTKNHIIFKKIPRDVQKL